MSTPQAKRRRLNEANKTLHKPFKSPFRTPLKATSSSDPSSSDPVEIITPGTEASTGTPPTIPEKDTPCASKTLPKVAHRSRRTPHFFPGNNVPKSASTPSKPNLARQIMTLRNEIQVLSQAKTLATSNKEADMVALIDLWRTASRAAAEEVFAKTRDRVNRMGGVSGWKEREREQKEWKMRAEREELEAERERLAMAREEAGIEEADDYGDYSINQKEEDGSKDEVETFKAADDDSFTMDMMLNTLNIDLKLIGYNKNTQRWDG